MFGIGAGEFIVILIVGLIVFGPSKLPEVGRAIGKGLREFRKAQAALSQTLNEVDDPPKSSTTVAQTSSAEKTSVSVEKTSTVDKAPVKPLTSESFVGEKSAPVEQPATVDAQPTTQPAAVEKAVDKPPQITADEVIKLAKESPLVKENHHEKISDGHSVDVADNAERTSPAGARSSSNGVDKQS